jgi:hypothetical protein
MISLSKTSKLKVCVDAFGDYGIASKLVFRCGAFHGIMVGIKEKVGKYK